MVARGKAFLKVSGILLIIFASLGILLGVLILAGGGLIAGMGIADQLEDMMGLGGLLSGMMAVLGVVLMLLCVLPLITGILGVKNANRPEKANVCLVFGIILAALSVLGLISSGDVVLFLIGVTLPVLYIIGAVLNKKSIAPAE